MTQEAYHQCGIAAVYIKKTDGSNGDASNRALFYLYKLLLNQQNRGQLSAGITTFNQSRSEILSTFKDLGTVNEVFKTSDRVQSFEVFKQHAGNKGIGHVRYATSGNEDKSLAQPFERVHGRKWKWFSFCFNGNLANYSELRQHLLEKADYHIQHENDTEILMHYLSRELKGSSRPDMVRVFRRLAEKLDGCYNIAFINAYGEIIVCRDPYGFRPVVYGWRKRPGEEDMFLVASESNALRNCGVMEIHDLAPGHLIQIENGNVKIHQFAKVQRHSRCMFEWVYFANVSSVIDQKSVYHARIRLGKQLAEAENLSVNDEDWIVVPVPDTAKPSGDAMAYELHLKSREGLIRNRYVGRTFIEGGSREDRIQNKFTALPEVLSGKKVIVVDDSIVRGTTTREIVKYIKEIGRAKEVHLRISCPPIRGPCFYGIDMSTIDELIVPRHEGKPIDGDVPDETLKKIAKDLGANSLKFQSIKGLISAIGIPEQGLCTACITGKYPTPHGKKLYQKAWDDYRKGIKGRAQSCG